jgi:hypothetical protein
LSPVGVDREPAVPTAAATSRVLSKDVFQRRRVQQFRHVVHQVVVRRRVLKKIRGFPHGRPTKFDGIVSKAGRWENAKSNNCKSLINIIIIIIVMRMMIMVIILMILIVILMIMLLIQSFVFEKLIELVRRNEGGVIGLTWFYDLNEFIVLVWKIEYVLNYI